MKNIMGRSSDGKHELFVYLNRLHRSGDAQMIGDQQHEHLIIKEAPFGGCKSTLESEKQV
jgi:hypothetical protein